MKNIKCFFAYPSQTLSHAEIIEQAIKELNKGKVVEVKGWKEISATGKFVIIEICKQIDSCNLFLCDLTNLNNNVLFELGYAVARNKRIFIFLDTNIEEAIKDFKKFNLLTTIGYSQYSNTREIVEAFYKEKPYEDLKSTLYSQVIESVINKQSKRFSTIFYLKSEIETEASLRLSRRVQDSKIRYVTDDPKEVRMQPLSWYIEEVTNSFCVIAHLLAQDHKGCKQHNAKISFISGLAFGLDKYLLMLAHEPFNSPIDYKELLKTHNTPSKCQDTVNQWLSEKENSYVYKKKIEENYRREKKSKIYWHKFLLGIILQNRKKKKYQNILLKHHHTKRL